MKETSAVLFSGLCLSSASGIGLEFIRPGHISTSINKTGDLALVCF